MSKPDASALISDISQAFQWRTRPIVLTNSKELAEWERAELLAITSVDWKEVTAGQWEKNYDAIFMMSPEAYCYYLPGVMKACIEDGHSNLIVVSSVIGVLDRSPNPDWWDNFFFNRWTLFTIPEYKVIQEWIFWLMSLDNNSYTDDTLERALTTIDLLIARTSPPFE